MARWCSCIDNGEDGCARQVASGVATLVDGDGAHFGRGRRRPVTEDTGGRVDGEMRVGDEGVVLLRGPALGTEDASDPYDELLLRPVRG
jgi:hypothetical protein